MEVSTLRRHREESTMAEVAILPRPLSTLPLEH